MASLKDDCNKSAKIKLCLLLVNTEKTGQILTFIMPDFHSEYQVTTQLMHSNVFLFVNFHLSGENDEEMKKIGYWKGDAIWDWNMRTRFSPCGLHYCYSHQVRDGYDCTKSDNRVCDAPKVRLYYDLFGKMLKTILNGTSKMDDISLAVSKVCILINIFMTETIPCDSYKITSETMDTYYDEVAQKMENDMSKFMYDEAMSILPSTDKNLGKNIEEVMKLDDN